MVSEQKTLFINNQQETRFVTRSVTFLLQLGLLQGRGFCRLPRYYPFISYGTVIFLPVYRVRILPVPQKGPTGVLCDLSMSTLQFPSSKVRLSSHTSTSQFTAPSTPSSPTVVGPVPLNIREFPFSLGHFSKSFPNSPVWTGKFLNETVVTLLVPRSVNVFLLRTIKCQTDPSVLRLGPLTVTTVCCVFTVLCKFLIHGLLVTLFRISSLLLIH